MSRHKQRRLMGDINVVPYIDVMLVLLIIFMITAPLLTQGISVDLPAVGAEPLDPELLSQNEPLILSLDREGRLYLNYGEDPNAPVDEEAVLTTTAAVIRRNAETPILIKSDQAVSVGRFAAAMVLLQRAGADSIGIITDPLDTTAPEER
jgi:biopolymer transport protein TolR